MAYTVTLIPGDGIGPEVTAAARRVLEATGVKFNWEIAEAGAGVMAKYGTPLPDSVISFHPEKQNRPQRTGYHSGRHRFSQRQCRPA